MMEQMCGMSDHNNEIQFTAHLRFTVGLQYLLKFSYVNFDRDWNKFSTNITEGQSISSILHSALSNWFSLSQQIFENLHFE